MKLMERKETMVFLLIIIFFIALCLVFCFGKHGLDNFLGH